MSGMFDGGNSAGVGTPGALDKYLTPAAAAKPSAAEQLVQAEQDRTEQQRISAIQQQLRLETTSRNRGYGLRSFIGSLGGAGGRSSLLGSG